MEDEDLGPPTSLTLAVAIVASVLCLGALFLLGLSGGENYPRGSTPATGPFVCALGGTISAWLAHIWLMEGHEDHATLAEVLTLVLFIGAAVWLF